MRLTPEMGRLIHWYSICGDEYADEKEWWWVRETHEAPPPGDILRQDSSDNGADAHRQRDGDLEDRLVLTTFS